MTPGGLREMITRAEQPDLALFGKGPVQTKTDIRGTFGCPFLIGRFDFEVMSCRVMSKAPRTLAIPHQKHRQLVEGT